jgi:hypothetical protein
MSPNVHENGWNGIDEEVDMVIERRVHATDPLNATSLRSRRGKQIRVFSFFFLFCFWTTKQRKHIRERRVFQVRQARDDS